MPPLPPDYEPLLANQVSDPSGIGLVLPRWGPGPELDELRQRLLDCGQASDFAYLDAEPGDDQLDALPPALRFNWTFGGDQLDCSVAVHQLGEVELIGGNPDSIPQGIWEQCVDDCPCIYLEVGFAGEPLTDYHQQLQILHRLAPDALLVNDLAACRYHTGAWLRAAATQRIAPAPQNLYWVHEFASEDGSEVWLHSHGLLRCGCPELEMMMVPGHAVADYLDLFHAVARFWIEQGATRPEEPLEAVQDLPLQWLPWEEVLARQADVLRVGGNSDRDEGHRAPAAVLLPAGSQSCDLSGLAPALADSPAILISEWETRRMSMQAKQGLADFRRLLRRFRGQKSWQFRAKLGYSVDPEDPEVTGEEHLWFDVHGFDQGQLDASLLDAPALILGLTQGHRQLHALDQLSDWVIRSPHGDFDANNVADLWATLETDAG